MTIDEAISHAREVAEEKRKSKSVNLAPEIISECELCAQEHDQLVEWLEELQQCRAIGTPEELKAAMKYVYLAKKHGTVGQVIENCVKYEEIGTPEECRAAMEKQKRKLVKNPYGTSYIWKAGYCPVCGCGVTARWNYCQCCGQKLNWENA